VSRRAARAAVAPLLALLAPAGVDGAEAARRPSPIEQHGIIAALGGQQGDVAIRRVTVSSKSAAYASIEWGFANNGYSALNSSVLGRAGGAWRVLWTRELEQPADGACVFVPPLVARDLLRVTCPAPTILHARGATPAELASIRAGFRAGAITRCAASSRLRRVCVSRLDARWAAVVAVSDVSGASRYVWFRRRARSEPTYDSMSTSGAPPPAVVLSLASCVGYNPAEYGG
jgi:hypothetical protein